MTYANHYCNVPATSEGIDLLNSHLLAGNQAAILTYYGATKLTKRNIGYVSLAKEGRGFWLGYNRKKEYLFTGYLKLVEPGYEL
jgi:hypothetical protein